MRMETRLANGVTNLCDSPFDPCQGQSEPPPVLIHCESSRSRLLTLCEGQSAMPRVSAQQIDSDDEETAFFAAESFCH